MTSMKKDATKFIVRYEEANDPLHQAVKEAAKAEHMSVNSFILRAIDRDINRGKTMDRLLDMAEQGMNTTVINVVEQDQAAIERFRKTMQDAGLT